MLSLLSVFSIGLRLFSAGLDFVNPHLAGGSMLDNGELTFC